MGLAQNVLVEIVRGNVLLGTIAQATGSPWRDVVNAVQRIKRRGLVTIVAPGRYAATEAGVAWVDSGSEIKSGQTTRRPRTATRGLRQRAWWVLRARKTLTLAELLATLADGSEKNAADNLRRYLKRLAEAGFLAVSPPRAGVAPRYRVVRDNGRKAPVVRQSAGTVYDPNSGEVFALERAS
jgi:hypothetical protein